MLAMSLKVSPVDLRLRVVAAALEPVVALARVMALPLDDLQKLVAIAYFREARSRGLTLRQIARKLRKSVRTVATLSKTSSELELLLASSDAVTCRREIVQHVAAQQTSSVDTVRAALPELKRDEVCAAIDQLVDEGILERDGDALCVAVAHLDLVQEDADHRIDSLRHFLRVVSELAYRRFFSTDRTGESFARVLTFRGSRSGLAEHRRASYQQLRAGVLDLDASAEDAEDAVEASVVVGFVETPNDPFWGRRGSG